MISSVCCCLESAVVCELWFGAASAAACGLWTVLTVLCRVASDLSAMPSHKVVLASHIEGFLCVGVH